MAKQKREWQFTHKEFDRYIKNKALFRGKQSISIVSKSNQAITCANDSTEERSYPFDVLINSVIEHSLCALQSMCFIKALMYPT